MTSNHSFDDKMTYTLSIFIDLFENNYMGDNHNFLMFLVWSILSTKVSNHINGIIDLTDNGKGVSKYE